MDDVSLNDKQPYRAAADAIRTHLEDKRAAINRELCTFPTPIPGCDVSFNRLLEDRARVVDELQRLDRLGSQRVDPRILAAFVSTATALDAEFKSNISAAIDAAAPR